MLYTVAHSLIVQWSITEGWQTSMSTSLCEPDAADCVTHTHALLAFWSASKVLLKRFSVLAGTQGSGSRDAQLAFVSDVMADVRAQQADRSSGTGVARDQAEPKAAVKPRAALFAPYDPASLPSVKAVNQVSYSGLQCSNLGSMHWCSSQRSEPQDLMPGSEAWSCCLPSTH